MDYNLLQTELTDPAYSGLDDESALAAVKIRNIQRVRRVPLAELVERAYGIGLPVTLRVVALTPEAPVELRAVCITLLDMLQSQQLQFIDIYAADGSPDPATAAMFDVLVAAGLLTTEQRQGFEALGLELVSREDILGLGDTSLVDIGRARGGAW